MKKISVSRSFPLKFFPTIENGVWFEDGFDRRFLLKCNSIDENSYDFFLTHSLEGDIEFSCGDMVKKPRVLFSANKSDLIKYTEIYDSCLDIFPVESMEFRAIDFIIDSKVDWVVFTSKRAVEFFFKRVSVRFMCDKKLAAVGDKTAYALMEKGFRLDYVPEEFYGSSLVDFLKDKGKLLVITAAKYNKIYDELDNVIVVPVYENVIPERIKYFEPKGEFDFGLFSSPSAFWHIKEAFGSYEFAKNIKRLVAIGKTTKSYIESCGFEAEMPEKATIDSIFKYVLDLV